MNAKRGIVTVVALCMLAARCSAAAEPIRVHPDNPHYFLFRGKPLVLITASEHYGSVINRPFNFERYLVDAGDKKQTLTRTFLLFRELQTEKNPWSPCKPESPDYIAPWPRTGPGVALDGEPKFDLDKWNPEFFERLDRFLRRSSELGVVVELTLFSNYYIPQLMNLSPLKADNNLQGVGTKQVNQFTTLKDPKLTERQLSFARKIVQETVKYDHVYYEICNEPYGDLPPDSTLAEVDAWQAEISKVVRDELKKLGGTHLVVGSPVLSVKPKPSQAYDDAIKSDLFDALTYHARQNLLLGGKSYDIGGFMNKDLKLAPLGAFCAAMRDASKKPFVFDEDNAASAYKDDEAWTIDRKRAWVTVMNQSHYDFIDFSITVGNEAGTPESSKKIRTWMKNLSEFIHSVDFVHAKADASWIDGVPANVHRESLAVAGKDYIAYFADARERTQPSVGEAIESSSVSFKLPVGAYLARFYSPISAQYSEGVTIRGGEETKLQLPRFEHDLVVRVTRSQDD